MCIDVLVLPLAEVQLNCITILQARFLTLSPLIRTQCCFSFSMYGCFACMHVCVPHVCSTVIVQRRAVDHLELEEQMVESHMLMLRI